MCQCSVVFVYLLSISRSVSFSGKQHLIPYQFCCGPPYQDLQASQDCRDQITTSVSPKPWHYTICIHSGQTKCVAAAGAERGVYPHSECQHQLLQAQLVQSDSHKPWYHNTDSRKAKPQHCWIRATCECCLCVSVRVCVLLTFLQKRVKSAVFSAEHICRHRFYFPPQLDGIQHMPLKSASLWQSECPLSDWTKWKFFSTPASLLPVDTSCWHWTRQRVLTSLIPQLHTDWKFPVSRAPSMLNRHQHTWCGFCSGTFDWHRWWVKAQWVILVFASKYLWMMITPSFYVPGDILKVCAQNKCVKKKVIQKGYFERCFPV